MMRYLTYRILMFIPTLFVISLLAFIISIKAPGDPVEIMLGTNGPSGSSSGLQISAAQKDSVRAQLGIDRPVFYFSLSSLADCDTLYKIGSKSHRDVLDRLTHQYGNWQKVSDWYLGLNDLLSWQKQFNPDSLVAKYTVQKDSISFQQYDANTINEAHIQIQNGLSVLLETYHENTIVARLDSLERIYDEAVYFESGKEKMVRLKLLFHEMKNASGSWKLYVPVIHWHGWSNQYHHWLSKLFLEGDFGSSYVDHEPVAKKIWSKFFISFKLIFISVLLAYLISIPIGVYAARGKGGWGERATSLLLFMLYSLPSFFVGMVLLMLFSNPDVLVWFPEAGYMDPSHYDPEWPFWVRWRAEWPYMVLPLITYTYSSFAFISRIMRSSMLENLNQDYIRTARAKGLDENKVLWRHALRNSLLPVITIFVNIFPMAIGGSVIIETIFTYPGMGLGSYEAIHNYDYPTIVAIFTLSGFLTMVGYLVADILYAIADPRISYRK